MQYNVEQTTKIIYWLRKSRSVNAPAGVINMNIIIKNTHSIDEYKASKEKLRNQAEECSQMHKKSVSDWIYGNPISVWQAIDGNGLYITYSEGYTFCYKITSSGIKIITL